MLGLSPRRANNPHPGFVAGRWYCPVNASLGVASNIGASGSIRMLPFVLPLSVTIAALAARVTTLSAGGNFQLAIYASDPATKLPTGPALCSTGNLSTAAATVVSGAVTPVALVPRTYWMAINHDNAVAAYQSMTAQSNSQALIGSATLANVTGASALAQMIRMFATAFGTWPDLTGQATVEAASNGAAVVFFQAG